MSDCANGGNGRWANVEWHAPEGRTVYVREGDRPCMVAVHFADPDELPREFPMALAGREVAYVTVDGVPYTSDGPDEAYEMRDGTVTAVVLGGVRYVREPGRDWDDCEVD